jgi:AcrR family transcriptional regulator
MSESSDDLETTDEIMRATYQAVFQHGYSATTISKIADEFDKSKSLIYYHYEDKEQLLGDFLEYLLDELESDLAASDGEDPKSHLLEIVDLLLPSDLEDERFRFQRALLELRAQAPYHESYRHQFERSDDLVVSLLVEAIEWGIEEDVFRAVNSREVAEFVYSAAYGAIERGVTIDDPEVLHEQRSHVESYLETNLFKYR